VQGGERERHLPGCRAGPGGISPLAVLLSRPWKTAFHSKVSEIEESLNQLRENLRWPHFSGLLLGLGLCSYHVRELLACWLFFSLLFVSLALVILGGVLACYAGKYFIHWASTAARVTPVVALGSGELHLQVSQALESSNVILPAETRLPNSA
jgi:hypothetical protein